MKKLKINKKTTIFILSPHYDDAVFSASSVLTKFAHTNPIHIINIFTRGSQNLTLSNRRQLKNAGVGSAAELYALRKLEDRLALSRYTKNIVNLDEIDAPWRTKNNKTGLFGELYSLYPFYRTHIIRGRISSYDDNLITRIEKKVLDIVSKHSNYLLFAPLGCGNHVDHRIARKVAEAIVPPQSLVYWLDFPYAARGAKIDVDLVPTTHHAATLQSDRATKEGLCQLYTSQYTQVFKDIVDIAAPETFYIPTKKRVRILSKRTKLGYHMNALMHTPKEYLFDIITHARSRKKIKIMPYHHAQQKAFDTLVKRIKHALPDAVPQLLGSSGLRIVGEGDIGVYIPTTLSNIMPYHHALIKLIGNPVKIKKHWVQWTFSFNGHRVELDLIDEKSSRYITQNLLFERLRSKHAKRLYEVFKYRHEGATKLAYALAKIIFFEQLQKRHQHNTVPHQLGHYKLIKAVHPDPQFPGAYHFGIYRDNAGNKIFCKLLYGSHNRLAKKWLRNEIIAYQSLSTTKTMDTATNIVIPKVHESLISGQLSYIMLEYVVGSDIAALSNQDKADRISKVATYLQSLQPSRIKVTKRPPWYWVILSAGLIVAHLFKRSLTTTQLVNVVRHYSQCVRAMLMRSERACVHRDLNYQNTLVAQNKTYLIDFQLMCIADPLLEYAVIFTKYATDTDYLATIKKTLPYLHLTRAQGSQQALKGYTIVLSLYDLLLRDGRHEVSLSYLQSLKKDRII